MGGKTEFFFFFTEKFRLPFLWKKKGKVKDNF